MFFNFSALHPYLSSLNQIFLSVSADSTLYCWLVGLHLMSSLKKAECNFENLKLFQRLVSGGEISSGFFISVYDSGSLLIVIFSVITGYSLSSGFSQTHFLELFPYLQFRNFVQKFCIDIRASNSILLHLSQFAPPS